MKSWRKYGSWILALSATLLLAGSALAPKVSQADAPSPEQVVQRAWQRAQDIGAYRFATEIVQTTYPAPALVNVGRSSRRDTLYIEGHTNLPERTLLMTLWQGGGSVLNPRDGIEVRVEGDQAYGRQIGGAWQEIDDFSDAFAPGNDLMAYLAGARNIRELGTETVPLLPDAQTGQGDAPSHLVPLSPPLSYTHYTFDVDGPAFARYLRDQLEHQLQARGELPLGLTLESPREYLEMTGNGEVWIDGDGLPLRLTAHLVYPEQRNGERVEADIQTDFFGFDHQQLAVSNTPTTGLAGALGLPRTPQEWQRAGHQVILAAGLLGLLVLLFIYRQSKKAYTVFVLVIVLSMVIGPLLQGQQVYAFSQRWAARRAEQEQRQEEQEAARDLQEQLTGNWDPHQDPLADQQVSEPVVSAAESPASYQSPFSSLYSPNLANDDEESADPDNDGLTTAQERLLGTDPANFDSDGDTLSDGAEVLRLGTDPWAGDGQDTDGDGIADNVEVAGFVLPGQSQRWYLDPSNADTNNDGQLDTIECPDLVRVSSVETRYCQDTDGDGIPDVFDRDDDGDGVPDGVDISPDGIVDRSGKRANAANPDPFDGDHPFALQVDDLNNNYPVFVDLQLRPANPDHLTYAFNVLDWPNEDIEGQIQHVRSTTFATTDNLDARSSADDAHAANGDMRLIPMLEIEMPTGIGRSVPLSLTIPAIDVQVRGDISATAHLEQQAGNPDNTTLEFAFAEAGSYQVQIYGSACPVAGSPLTTYSDVVGGTTYTYSGMRLVNLADGEHAIVVSGGGKTTCATIGNVVNGPYTDRMIDPAPLAPYGISVREKNTNGTLAAYVPLNVVADETGGGRVAFSARMLYWPGTDRTWAEAQKVRVVWMLQMLTDGCDPEGFQSDHDPEEEPDEYASDFDTWCADAGHRTPDQVQVVHTFDEQWVLTGLAVREDHGLDVAVAYADPAHSDYPENEGDLWLLAWGLALTFVAGRDCEDDNASNNPDYDPGTGLCHDDSKRDIAVFGTNREGSAIGNSTIQERFDRQGSVPDGDDRRWGIPKNALQVENLPRYDHQDYAAYLAMTETPRILAQFSHAVTPTLLFAREEHYRSAGLDAGSWQNQTFTVAMDPAAYKEETVAALNWAPFRYNSGIGPDGQVIGWESYPIREYWDQLEVDLKARFMQFFPEDSEYINLGRAVVARSFYVSLLQGMATRVQNGLDVQWTPNPGGGDSDAALVKAVLARGSSCASKIYGVVWKVTRAAYEYYGLHRSVVRIGGGSVDWAMGVASTWEGLDLREEFHGFWESLGKGIKDFVVTPWTTLFKGGLKARVGLGIAVVGAVAAVGITIYGATQKSGVGIAVTVLYGVNVIMAIHGAVTMASKVIQAVQQAGSFSAAAAKGLSQASQSIKSSFKSAAVVGLVIGVLASWAAFGVQVGLSGGMSRIALGTALAAAIAATIVTVILFVISCIPIVGQIIAAVIGLIDAVVGLLCNVFLSEEQRGHAAAQWFCGGISGLATNILANLIYGGNVMVEIYPEDYQRLEFGNFDADDLVYPEKGIAVGNSVRYGVSLTSTIRMSALPANIGATYRYQYNDGNLRSSTFQYALQTTETPFHDGLDRNTMSGEWQYADGDGPDWGDFGHTWRAAEPVFITRTLRHAGGVPFTEEGLNRPTLLILSEAYAIPSQNCILGICTVWTERGTEHYNVGQSLKFDVFPATLDRFYELAEKQEGYALAWGQSGAVTFPRLADADGDGLRADVNDPDDSRWDSDYDGLSDWYETQTGSSPASRDSDGDGLGDYEEVLYGTNPNRPDTDGDGLTDGEEVWHQDIFDQDYDGDYAEWVGGWEYVYDLTDGGTPLSTWVTPNPLDADGDGDALTDFQEKVLGFHPRWPSTPSFFTFESQVNERAGGVYTASDGFVQPGDTLYYSATVENELYNRWAQGLLSTDFPPMLDAQNVLPQSFILYPQQQQIMSGSVDVDNAAASGVYSLTQVAGALITDWSELAGSARLWLPFEDPVARDRSGSIPPHDGTCVGTCATTLGRFGNGLNLDGTSYMTSAYDPSETAYAVSLWFKADSSHASGALYSVNHDYGVQVYLSDGDVCAKLVYQTGSGHSYRTRCSSGGQYADGQWHHVVHTYGSAIDGQRLYVDGMQVASSSEIPEQRTAGINVGHSTRSDISNFNGQIDDVRVFDEELSVSEVQALFDQPVFSIKFDEDTGWQDHSGFGNDGSCSGANCPGRGNGILGRAASFDGTDYISVGPDTSLGLNGGRFTLAAWIYPTDSPQMCVERKWLSPDCIAWQPQPQGILGLNGGESDAYPTLQRVGRKVRFGFGTGSRPVPYYTTSGDVLAENAWNHVAATFDQGTVKLYVNGVQVGVDAVKFAGQVPPAVTEFTIGRAGDIARLTIDRIRVDDEGDGVQTTGELCMAFQSGGAWQSIFDRDVQGGLVDANHMPLFYPVDQTVTVNDTGRLRMWEDDGDQKCVTTQNQNAADPQDDGDDDIGTWWFYTTGPSRGSVGDSDEHLALEQYSGDGSGFFYLLYDNDSIPFYGRIDEVQVYNRPLDGDSVTALYRAATTALHMRFDDPPGETAFEDAGVGRREGACSAGACPTAGVSGRVNQAAGFDAAERDRVELGDFGDFGTTSAAAWVYRTASTGARETIVSYKEDAGCGFVLALNPSGSDYYPTFWVKVDDSWYSAQQTQTVPLNTWVHLAGTYDGQTLRLYRDGQEVGSASAPGAMLQCAAGSAIGSSSSKDMHFFPGRIDDVYVFSRAISAGEVVGLYQAAPNLHLRLDEPAGATTFAADAGSGYQGTCSGDACPTTGVPGKLGLAAQFDGVNDRISVARPPSEQFMNWRSVGLWVKPTQVVTHAQTLLAHDDEHAIAANSFRNLGLWIRPDTLAPTLSLGGCSDSARRDADSEVPLVPNAWNHVVATRAADRIRIYVNGYERGSASLPSPFCYNDLASLLIGNDAPGAAPFYGQIDEVTLYRNALSASEVLYIFQYQSKWIEERQSHDITVDADNPTSELQFDFSHWANRDVQVLVTAHDPTSGISRVQVGVCKSAGTCAPAAYTWSDAPRCWEAEGDGAWCPTFVPSGEGRYSLKTRATDFVGHTAESGVTTIYVDDQAPSLAFDFADEARRDAFRHPTQSNAWAVHLSGTVSDLPTGDGGSGMAPDGVHVTLYNAASGALAGPSEQPATVTGSAWALDYTLTEVRPTGRYTVTVQAADRVAQIPNLPADEIAPHTASATRRIQVDATTPVANLDLVTAPGAAITGTLPLGGDATERPVPLKVTWTTPDGSGDQVGLTIGCDGVTLFSAAPGTYPAESVTRTWDGRVHKGASCQVGVTGGVTGTVQVCGSPVTSWAGGDTGASFTADSAACDPDTAIAGVNRVEIAFTPALPGSSLYNEIPPAGEMLHLPFDDAAAANGALRFRDVSGQGLVGVCSGASCPTAGQPGHSGASARFDGNDAVVLGNFGAFTTTTVSAWVYRTADTQAPQFIVIYKGRATCGFRLTLNDVPRTVGYLLWQRVVYDHYPRFWVNVGGSWQFAEQQQPVPLNTWVHLAGVYDGQTLRLYRDGQQVAATPAPGAMGQCTAGSTVGNLFPGRIDEVRVFDRALSAGELRGLYLGAGPVLALPLDETWATDGTILPDVSGWQHDGTLHTAGTSNNLAVAGQVGPYALNLEGGNHYVAVPDSPALDLSTFSVGAWIMPYWTTSQPEPLVVKRGSSSAQQNYGLYLYYTNQYNGNSGHLRFAFGDCAATGEFNSTGTLNWRQWNHVMMTYDGARFKVYINGALDRSVDVAAAPCQNDEPVKIGGGVPSSSLLPFAGRMDDVRIYPRALSGPEVNALYRSAWRAATLAGGAGTALATWTAQPPAGLEGAYRLDLRGWDTGGHFDTAGETQGVWQGEVDTLAPRLTLTRTLVGSAYRYTAVAQDFSLTEDGLRLPCDANVSIARQYFQSPWYQTLSPGGQRLYELTAECDIPAWQFPGQVGATDTPGLARSVAISGTTAYVADGEAGLIVIDISDPAAPRLAGAYDTPGDAVGVAVPAAPVAGTGQAGAGSPAATGAPGPAVQQPEDAGGTARPVQNLAPPDRTRGDHASAPGQAPAEVYDVVAGERQGSLQQPGFGVSDRPDTRVSYNPPESVPGVPGRAPTGAGFAAQPPTVLAQSGEVDLTVENVVVEPVSPHANQPFTVAVTVQNIGSQPANGFDTGVYADAVPQGCDCCAHSWDCEYTVELNGGETTVLTFTHPGFAEVGLHTIYAQTDSYCAVQDDPNTENNIYGPVLVAVDAFTVTATYPAGNDLVIARDGVISATFSQPLSTTTVSTRTFAVRGHQTGVYTGAHTFGSVQFDAARDFKPGEEVVVNLSDGIRATDGRVLVPYVWQFRAAVAGGTGAFSDTGQLIGSYGAYDAALADLDGDGDLDAVTQDEPLLVWRNDGTGVFTDTGQSVGGSNNTFALDDVDGDGDLDLFIGARGILGNTVWLNDGSGVFTDTGQSLISADTRALALGDLDGDGDLDAFVGNSGAWPSYTPSNEIWWNDGTGVFTDSLRRLGSTATDAVALADLDGDGSLDAFLGKSGADEVWLNDGLGNFRDSSQRLGSAVIFALALGDVDGDGNLDALVGNSADSQVWVNDGAGVFTDTGQSLTGAYNGSAVLDDLDGDGDLDAVLGTGVVWMNDGTGVFTDTGATVGYMMPAVIVLGDLDGDGDLDAFLGQDDPDLGLDGNTIWLNVRLAQDDGFFVPKNSSGNTLDVRLNDIHPAGRPLTITAVSQPANGDATTDGSVVVYTPTLDFVGVDVFTYTVTDPGGLHDTPTVTVTVGGANDPPDAVDDLAGTNEDTPVTIDVLANDSDPNGQTPFPLAVGTPAHGGAGLLGNQVAYTPTQDFNGTDTFTYTISDGWLTDTAHITVTVQPVNDAPLFTAGPDQVVAEDSGQRIVPAWATGIAPGPATATDEVGQVLTFTLTNNNNALFSAQPGLSAAGALTFTPAANANGVARVWATLRDSGGTANGGVDTSAMQSFVITVTAVNDAPQANDITRTTPEDTPLSVTIIPGQASDVDGDPLTVSGVGAPASGTATTDGSRVVYTPTLNSNGIDVFTYTVSDPGGLADTATITVTVTPVNDPPTLNPLSNLTTDEDAGMQTVDLSGISSGASNETQALTVTAASRNTSVIPHPAVAYTSPDTTGTLHFQPVANAFGAATLAVTVTDGLSQTVRTFQVTVTPINDPPTLDPILDVEIYADAGPQTVALSGISAGPNETQALSVTASSSDTGLLPHPTVVYTSPNSTGSLRLSPLSGQSGAATVAVTVTDGLSRTNRTFQVTVSPFPPRPYAYVADQMGGLRVVDISDPRSPTPVGALTQTIEIVPGWGTYFHPIDARDVAVRGQYAYVAADDLGLVVVDVIDPADPTEAGVWQVGSWTDFWGIALSGNYAYIADYGTGRLWIVDISDPTNPVGASNYSTSWYALDVAVSGGYAYVAIGGYGLEVVNVADPWHPQRVRVFDTLNAKGVAVSGNYAYVADDHAGLLVVDISDPGNPRLVRSFDTPGHALDAAVSGGLVYVADYDQGLRVVNPEGLTQAQATACDTASHCTTAVLGTADSGMQSAEGIIPLRYTPYAAPNTQYAAQNQGSAVGVSIHMPPVLDSAAPISVTGEAETTVSSLRALTVTVDGGVIHTDTWASGDVTRTIWSADWTPSGEGQHLLEAVVTDWAGNAAGDTVTVTVDTQPPEIAIAPTVLTSTRYYEPRTLDLTGLVTDTGGVASVGWHTQGGDWQGATLNGNQWTAPWPLGSGLLPDGATYTVTARAVDIVGRSTEITQPVTVDVMPPQPVELALTNGGAPIAPGDTLRAVSSTLMLTWTASSDGSGLGDYLVHWTTQVTETVQATDQLTSQLASQLTASDGQKVSVQLGCQDIYGQQRWQEFGPVYVDSPLTPDYVWMGDVGQVGNLPYHGWMESGCTLIGVDRRVNRRAMALAALEAEQRFYATWNAEALRLAWTGANWNTDGDLFIYLDTLPGGATTAFDPYTATMTNTVISLPTGFAADALVWVQDGETALLLGWDDANGDWEFVTVLLAGQYWFDAALNGGQTDLYLPFDVIGLAGGGSLDLLAFASEEDALRLWAVMPNANAVNSEQVIGTVPFAGDTHEFALSHRYHWDSLSDGVCPNGSDDPASARAYLDADVQVRVSADPPGAAYNLLGDNLFWLQDLLLGSPPPDVTSFLNFIGAGYPPLGNGQAITYTIHYHNRGTYTTTNVTAVISASYTLLLTPGGSQRTINLGDIGPGEEGTVTFNGVVTTSRSAEAWAAVQVRIYDAAHGLSDPPLEWLWAHHRVDRSGPEFFGIQQPGYWIAAGGNTLCGYAYDESGVPAVTVEIQGGSPLVCPDATPGDGQWTCGWDTAGASDGDTFNVRLRAFDGFGQDNVWSDALPFIVDARPPTITLDFTATQVFSGSLVRGSTFTLIGDAFDDGGVERVDVCVESDCGSANLQLGAAQSAASYEDVPASPMAIGSGAGCITRIFTVTEDFAVAQVSLGLTAEHPHRDDLQVELTSPAGTPVRVLADDDISGTAFRNYDVLLNDAAPIALADARGDDDPAGPLYERLARPYQPLRAFQGQDAQGNWTLRICDQNPSVDNGHYIHSRLVLTPRDTNAKSGRWIHQTPDVGALDYVSRTIGIYGQDVVGNRTAAPLSLVVWVDNVAPVVTVTTAIPEFYLSEGVTTVLSGTVTDGGPTNDVVIHVRTPAGESQRYGAARDGDRWWFDLRPWDAGRYILWVNASDLAGNVTTVGPFEVNVKLHQVFLPLVARNFAFAPDLIVERIVAGPNAVTVVIRNQGNAPVVDDFWVDAYINPHTMPTAVNQIWNDLAPQGLVWGVTADLPPGHALTLTIGDAYYVADYSHVVWPLAAGTSVYAQVDSASADTTYGGVLETHEITGGAYNNIAGPVHVTSAVGGAATGPPAANQWAPAPHGDLPRRR